MNLAGCGDHDDLLYISVLIDHVEELYEWTRSTGGAPRSAHHSDPPPSFQLQVQRR